MIAERQAYLLFDRMVAYHIMRGNVKHDIIVPYADRNNTEIFKKIQKLESVGVVVPNGTPHMYYAAMESKSCRLTATGKYYWSLFNKNLI